jgi:hypothetical protein
MTLAGLFELIAGVGLLLGLVIELECFGVVVASVAAATLLAACHVIFAGDRRAAWRLVLCSGLIGLLPALWSLWVFSTFGVRGAREAGRRSQCSGHLCGIALALHHYHDQYGHFPPAYIADASGKPMHSWRVLILPYLGGQLHTAYNFNEPWDGPNNSKLANQMPANFRCPSDKQTSPNMTSYFYVLNAGRQTPGSPPIKLSDIKDDPTIMLIESNTARVNWLEPRDLSVAEMIDATKSKAAGATAAPHHHDSAMWRTGGSFMVAMHDASRRPLPADIDADTLRALLSIDGGEQVELPDFDKRPKRLRPEFVALVSLTAAFVVLAILRRLRTARKARQPGNLPRE